MGGMSITHGLDACSSGTDWRTPAGAKAIIIPFLALKTHTHEGGAAGDLLWYVCPRACLCLHVAALALSLTSDEPLHSILVTGIWSKDSFLLPMPMTFTTILHTHIHTHDDVCREDRQYFPSGRTPSASARSHRLGDCFL